MSTSNRNKNRIYFCVYFQQGVNGTNGNPRVFHCGLWVENKNSRGGGDFFHVQFHGPRPTNKPHYPEGWAYDSSVMRGRQANWRHSGNLIGRILLGKLPAGITAADVDAVCQGVPMPRGNENCWDWTHNAVSAIQARRWLAAFPWSGANGFGARAYAQAVTWYTRDPKMNREHSWDMFGTESPHCVIM